MSDTAYFFIALLVLAGIGIPQFQRQRRRDREMQLEDQIRAARHARAEAAAAAREAQRQAWFQQFDTALVARRRHLHDADPRTEPRPTPDYESDDAWSAAGDLRTSAEDSDAAVGLNLQDQIYGYYGASRDPFDSDRF